MRTRPGTFYRRTPDRTLLRDTGRRDPGGIYDGTVGWEDGEDHFDIGDDGVTLVKVTLHKGRMPDTDDAKNSPRAKGTRVLTRISAPLYNIPPDGAEVHVSMPAGRLLDPGAGAIIAQLSASPDIQFSGTKAKLDFGPDVDVVLKARSVTITDYENRFISVSPTTGIKAGDKDGSGFCLKSSKWLIYAAVSKTAVCALELSENKIFATCKPHSGGDSSGFKFSGGNCTVMCQQYTNTAGGGCLGGTASPVSGIQYGPGFGIPSTSWKVAT